MLLSISIRLLLPILLTGCSWDIRSPHYLVTCTIKPMLRQADANINFIINSLQHPITSTDIFLSCNF